MAQRLTFLGLPGELRNIIYALVFDDIADTAIIHIRPRRHLLPRKQKRLALLLVCRQIRFEAFEYVYGEVRAYLRLPDFVGKHIYPLYSMRRVARRLDSLGHVLPFVSRLDVSDSVSLKCLSVYHSYGKNPFEYVNISDSAHRLVTMRKRVGALYEVLCQRLCNVKIVTVVGNLAKHPAWPARYWLLDVLALRTWRQRIKIALPNLVEIRVVAEEAHMARSLELGARFRLRDDGEWVTWDGAHVVPCLDDL